MVPGRVSDPIQQLEAGSETAVLAPSARTAGTAPQTRRASATERLLAARADLLAAGGYLALAVCVLSGQWRGTGSGYLVDSGQDQFMWEWFFAETAHAIGHLQNPLGTHLQNFPAGVNMMANTAMFGVGVPLTPVTMLFGPTVTFVLVLTLGLSGTAFAWYWLFSRELCRHATTVKITSTERVRESDSDSNEFDRANGRYSNTRLVRGSTVGAAGALTLSVPSGIVPIMARFTTFRYCIDPTVEQQAALCQHAGASRFAYNQCLATVKAALQRRRRAPDVRVPWTKFSLINEFNRWKRSEDAGRLFTVDSAGVSTVVSTGLSWRSEVSAQVFEEAAVDLANGLKAFTESRGGARSGHRMGFPRWKRKHRSTPSFRLRNKTSATGRAVIRVGEHRVPRSITLPTLGLLRVREDTRRLRRLLSSGRGKILSATVSYRAGRWLIAVTIEATDLHPSHHHSPRSDRDAGGWVGVDRDLSAFLVAATCLAKAVTRKQSRSGRRARAAARLARHHRRIRNIRIHFLHRCPRGWPRSTTGSRWKTCTSPA